MTDAKLDFWIQNNYNVLFIGRHGVGKTARIVDAFNRNNLKWKYFSASTLDPWVDFVGVPKETKDENGNAYLDLVRPKHFAEDEVEAIFMDEYNRAPSKIRNATMELLQFKSINGKKFENLKIIWAAVNPEKDENDTTPEYDVERIDPAQKDRFEIQVEVPYRPDISYFKNKYGEDIGKTATSWWNDLNEAEQKEVSPRRLDYAIDIYTKGGDLRDVLSKKLNVSKLVSELKSGNFREKLDKIFSSRDDEEAKKFLTDENSYTNTIKYILADKEKTEYLFPFLPEEKQSNLISTNDSVMKYAVKNSEINSGYKTIIDRLKPNNVKLAKIYDKWLRNKPMNVVSFEKFTFGNVFLASLKLKPNEIRTSVEYDSYEDMLINESKGLSRGTPYRLSAYKSIAWYLYEKRGYKMYNGRSLLSQTEIESSLNILNDIITSTYSFEKFKDIQNVYGILCRDYLSRFGKKQNYNTLSRKVHEFLNQYGNLYL